MWMEETKSGKFKFVEQYTDYMTGKRRRVSVTMEKNNAAARRSAMEALAKRMEKQRSEPPEASGLTLAQLTEKYMRYQQKTLKPATYRRNLFATEALKELLHADTLVCRLTANYIKECFLESGKPNSTLNEHRARLFALLRWGYENDYIDDISFLKKIKPFQDTSHREKIQDKYLEPEEVRALLGGMSSKRWRLLTEFLLLSGLRIGEAAALETADIDLKRHILSVCKTFDANNRIVTTPKTMASAREVYLTPELEDVCRRILRSTRQSGTEKDCRGRLFLADKDGGYLHYYSYNKYLKEHAQKSIGRKITPHTLRHTHASLLLAQGVDIDTIARRLGHEDSKITREIYLHITKELVDRDNRQLRAVRII